MRLFNSGKARLAVTAGLSTVFAFGLAVSTAQAEYAGFPDVNQNDWYASVVDWSNEHHAVNGFPDGTWGPNETVDRAQAITIVYNLNGSPSVEGQTEDFSDVNSGSNGDWFAPAVIWGKAQGVAHGYDGTTLFGPYDKLTRQQAATLLMNYVKGAAPSDDVLGQFPDGSDYDGWAKAGLSWAVKAGVISGVDSRDANGNPVKLLDAKGLCSRAQFVAMLQRVYQLQNPSTPDTPSTPTTPSTPSKPESPSTPNTPSTPSKPSTPETPDTPSTPSTPDTPSTPSKPTTPDKPTTSNPGHGDNEGGFGPIVKP